MVHAVKFLTSDQASFITGEDLTIDGRGAKTMIYHNDGGWIFQPKD